MNPNNIVYKQIIFTNDFHSNLPYGADFIENLYKYKNSGAMLIDIGDFTDGNSFYEFSKGLVEREIASSLFDILIPGNHGFNDILKLLGKVRITNCNIFKEDKLCFSEYEIININSYKVAIIGVMSQEAFLSIPLELRGNLSLKDPLESVVETVSKIRQDVDFVILGSHSGVRFDKSTFVQIKEIDILLSSHCHTPGNIFDYKTKLIRKADEEGRSIGEIKFDDHDLRVNIHATDISKRNFKHKQLVKFNKSIKNFSLEYSRKIGDLNNEQLKLLKNRSKLLKQLINHENNIKNLSFFINYTFIRNTNLTNTISKEDISNLIPFDTNLLLIKDFNENIGKFVESIPNEIKKMSLNNTKLNNGSMSSILTTDYLYDNFYLKSSELVLKKINVRKILMEAIK